MILFWIIYLSLSASIAYLFSMFFKKRIIKIFVFSFFVALMATFWFRSPGDNLFAPVFSIFLLESTILDNSIGSLDPLFLCSFLFFLFLIFSVNETLKMNDLRFYFFKINYSYAIFPF